MQYTIRNIPEDLDRQIREQARREGLSLNEVVIDRLRRAFGLKGELRPQRDLTEFVGSWIEDSQVDEALAAQRAVDREDWE